MTDDGAAAIEKSAGGAAALVLKNATPADQYIAAGKLPAMVCAAGAPRFRKPVITVATLGVVSSAGSG